MSLSKNIVKKYKVVAYDPAERKVVHEPEDPKHSYDPRESAKETSEQPNAEKPGRVHLVSVTSEISEDDYRNGEGESVGAGLSEKVGKTFPSMEKMLEYLASHFGLSKDLNDYEEDDDSLQTDKQVADHSEEQNGGWMTPTPEEIREWKAGKTKLYTEHFRITFHKLA